MKPPSTNDLMQRLNAAFTVAGLALMGVPGLCGFISKWQLVRAAVDSRDPLAYIGVAALMISALLTAIYMLTIVVRAFFPRKDFDYETIRDVKDPGWKMLLPFAVFVAAIVTIGLRSRPLIQGLEAIAAQLP